jgi:ubiquinone/menaquinone biosynthesis C-methylase UbiE
VDHGQAFNGNGSAARYFAQQPGWWESHYVDAVDEIVEFLAGDGVSLNGRRVLDLGCGDGILTLGLASRSPVASIIGLDLEPVDLEFLAAKALEHGVSVEQPRLAFGLAQNSRFDISDHAMDLVTTWSVFEHVSDVPGLLAEIRRVLVPNGLLFIQIWPLFFSEHGSHLWQWFDEPFAHLRLSDEEFRAQLQERIASPELAEAMLELYASCNRLTLDQLGSALNATGFYIAKVETDRAAAHIPPEVQDMDLSLLTTAGVKILAVSA